MLREGWTYFFSLLNLAQVVTVFLNVFIICFGYFRRHELAEESNEYILVTLPSITAFMMVIQIFDWMALFEQTSFFVTMLIASFDDIYYFMVLLFICIFAFTNAISIIEQNQRRRFEFNNPGEDYATFIDQKDKFVWIDALLSEWLLGLGEFETAEFDGEN